MVIFAYRYIRKYIEYLIYIIFKILRIWLMIYKLKILLQLQQSEYSSLILSFQLEALFVTMNVTADSLSPKKLFFIEILVKGAFCV